MAEPVPPQLCVVALAHPGVDHHLNHGWDTGRLGHHTGVVD